jgi:preprotein translocase subunit SecF
MKYKNLFLSISISLIILTAGLLMFKPLNLGIDFTGGSILQCKMDKKAPLKEIRKELKKHNITASVVKFETDKEFLIKVGLNKTTLNVNEIFNLLKKEYPSLELRRTEHIGAKVGNELAEKGTIALLLTILIILIYVSLRFEWRFAVASSIALLHDVFITLGLIILLNVNLNLEILAALLTILGYSINDTIVVFDRIRENLEQMKIKDLDELINKSINETLTRTLLTSLTTLFVVLSVFLFGGDMVSGLSITLLIGITIGTYSSIFIASPLLKILNFNISEWNKKIQEKNKLKAEREKQRAMYENGIV